MFVHWKCEKWKIMLAACNNKDLTAHVLAYFGLRSAHLIPRNSNCRKALLGCSTLTLGCGKDRWFAVLATWTPNHSTSSQLLSLQVVSNLQHFWVSVKQTSWLLPPPRSLVGGLGTEVTSSPGDGLKTPNSEFLLPSRCATHVPDSMRWIWFIVGVCFWQRNYFVDSPKDSPTTDLSRGQIRRKRAQRSRKWDLKTDLCTCTTFRHFGGSKK